MLSPMRREASSRSHGRPLFRSPGADAEHGRLLCCLTDERRRGVGGRQTKREALRRGLCLVCTLTTTTAILRLLHRLATCLQCFGHRWFGIRKRKGRVFIQRLFASRYTESAQAWITQFYLQTTPCLPFLRERSPDVTTTATEAADIQLQLTTHLSTPKG